MAPFNNCEIIKMNFILCFTFVTVFWSFIESRRFIDTRAPVQNAIRPGYMYMAPVIAVPQTGVIKNNLDAALGAAMLLTDESIRKQCFEFIADAEQRIFSLRTASQVRPMDLSYVSTKIIPSGEKLIANLVSSTADPQTRDKVLLYIRLALQFIQQIIEEHPLP